MPDQVHVRDNQLGDDEGGEGRERVGHAHPEEVQRRPLRRDAGPGHPREDHAAIPHPDGCLRPLPQSRPRQAPVQYLLEEDGEEDEEPRVVQIHRRAQPRLSAAERPSGVHVEAEMDERDVREAGRQCAPPLPLLPHHPVAAADVPIPEAIPPDVIMHGAVDGDDSGRRGELKWLQDLRDITHPTRLALNDHSSLPPENREKRVRRTRRSGNPCERPAEGLRWQSS
mmetsp:Transcript_67122/g.154130  ORF Transcript_67122/g.154130 Transcript_67122/m.154130 type:complete len:226 (+) Transcript_67122:317-994(+)